MSNSNRSFISTPFRVLVLGVAVAAASTAQAGVVNGDFTVPERTFVDGTPGGQCDIADMCDGQLGNEVPGWELIDLGEQFVITDVSGFSLLDGAGDTVVRFSEHDDALSGNDDGIAQCISLPDGLSYTGEDFAFQARAAAQFPRAGGTGELPVELAVKFYPDANCADELNTSLHLRNDLTNLAGDENVFFQRFDLVMPGTAPNQGSEALEADPWEWATATLSGQIPQIGGVDAASMAVFIGTGDQTLDGDTPDGPRQVYLDRMSLTVDGLNEGDNLLTNGDFDQFPGGLSASEFFAVRTPWPDDDQGPFGWYLTDLETDGGAAVEVLPNPDRGLDFTARSGDRAFLFRAIDDTSSEGPENTNDDNLDQCVDIRDLNGGEFSYSAWLLSNEGNNRVDVVLSYEFFQSADDCLSRLGASMDSPLSNADDVFTIDGDLTWERFETFPTTLGNNDHFVRLSIRVADSENEEDPNLLVFLDDVRIAGLSDEEENGENGAPGAGGSGSSSSSSTLGCTLGQGANDPTLVFLALLALMGLARQRSRSA